MNQTVEQFQKIANDYNKLVLDTWSCWTEQTIKSEAFSTASGAFMDWSLATQKMMTDLSGQYMESMDIPKRSDLARLSSQVNSVESRLLDQEESQDEIRDLLTTLLSKVEALGAAKEETAKPKKQTRSKAKTDQA